MIIPTAIYTLQIMTSSSESIGEFPQGWKASESFLKDDEIVKRFDACMRKGFPICLDLALEEIFGDRGIELVKSVASRQFIDLPNIVRISRPIDIWKLYLKYLSAWSKAIGNDSTKVIEHKAMERMRKDLHCEKCPMFELELRRLASTQS